MIKIMKYGEVSPEEVFARTEAKVNVTETVTAIIEDVRKRGDEAVKDYTEKFDGARPESLLVSEEEMNYALGKVEPEFMATLERAAKNIRAFHQNQVRTGFVMTGEKGIVMGQRIQPLDKVGIYVPGGTAAYPSTVLMDSIPAVLAGVKDVVMATPFAKDGRVNPYILAAAYVAGVTTIAKSGGAQVIAALAYGTESIPKVDKIVGPGNAFVAEAKRQVFGQVAIDMIAGPSEILVVADGKSNPRHVAADLLSQAEHDKMSSAVLVTDSEELAVNVQAEIEMQLKELIREDIARASIENNGKIIVAENLMQAIEISNEIAPEHLELCMDNPFDYLDAVKHAGSVFLGRNCPEALGDYMAGPNHTLPTVGTARFSSPLSVDDFYKKSQYTYFSREAFLDIAEDVARFADKEGLTAHKRSALIRTED